MPEFLELPPESALVDAVEESAETATSLRHRDTVLPPEHQPRVDMLPGMTDTAPAAKPTWRGWIHAATVPIAIVLGIVLVCVADGVLAKLMCGVFFASSILLFGISSIYHRFTWSAPIAALWRRLDHANIFLLIAGTYTPVAVLVLPYPKSVILLSFVWGGAIIGIAFRVFWLRAPRWLYVPLYLILGWAALFYIVDLFAAAPVTMILVLAGGVFYSVGAVFYALKRPNPWPGRFGFHELFHLCTVLAFLCHWVGVLLIAIDPPAR